MYCNIIHTENQNTTTDIIHIVGHGMHGMSGCEARCSWFGWILGCFYALLLLGLRSAIKIMRKLCTTLFLWLLKLNYHKCNCLIYTFFVKYFAFCIVYLFINEYYEVHEHYGRGAINSYKKKWFLITYICIILRFDIIRYIISFPIIMKSWPRLRPNIASLMKLY